MLDNYRREKLLIPEDRFKSLLGLINESKRNEFIHKIGRKDNNWGQIIGGKRAYKLNKKAFEEGRRKGSHIVKYEFDINMPLSEELCEFLGVIIGDGCTNKYQNMYQTQIAGDKMLDKEYYLNRFSHICTCLFNIQPNIIFRPSGLYVNLYSKRVFELLTKRFKIPKGIKCYTVKIPAEIIHSSDNLLKHTLVGMFNTDGGVGFDKRKAYKKPYIRINYTSVSKQLISQLNTILNNFHISHSVHTRGSAQMIQINGERNVKLFLSKIGFSSPRHLKKVSYLIN